MSSPNKKISVALSSVIASFLLTVMKLVVGLATGSMGILSEAAHSLLDLGAAALTYFAVRVSDKPADDEHPYGHGKVESVSALIETGLLFLTSIWIVYEAVHRLIKNNIEVQATWYAFATIIISILVDISRSRALKKVAKATKSQALEADALHFSSDIYSSAVVLVGLVIVALGLKRADAIAAIGVALFVMMAGYRLGKRTIDVLIDAAPAGTAEIARFAAEAIEGVIAVERIRVRPLGPSVAVDMDIKISRKLPLAKVEDIIRQIEDRIRIKLPEGDLVVRAKPAQLDKETLIEEIQLQAAKHNLSVHDILVERVEEKQFVSYDLEVPEKTTVGEAHRIASHLEKTIRQEIGNTVEINTHIEPLGSEAITSTDLTQSETNHISQIIREIMVQTPLLREAHNIHGHRIGQKLFITLHCYADEAVVLEDAHDATARLEYLIKEKVPHVRRAIVHVEPFEE